MPARRMAPLDQALLDLGRGRLTYRLKSVAAAAQAAGVA